MANAHLNVDLSIAIPRAGAQPRTRTPVNFAVLAVFPLAALVAVASLGGILFPSVLYARETPNWVAQAIGQDWVDLLLGVPWLLASAGLAARGSRRGRLLLAGGLGYFVYEFLIYAFAVHFNALFPVYCAVLGLSFFCLLGVTRSLADADVTSWYQATVSTRPAAVFLIGVGVMFAALWLGEIIPAIIHGAAPRSVSEAGLVTNPVHVIDLSIVLPLHVLAGVALLRRRPSGYWLAPVVLGFGVLMAASIVGLMIVMGQRGFGQNTGALGAMVVVTLASAAFTTSLLGRVTRRRV